MGYYLAIEESNGDLTQIDLKNLLNRSTSLQNLVEFTGGKRIDSGYVGGYNSINDLKKYLYEKEHIKQSDLDKPLVICLKSNGELHRFEEIIFKRDIKFFDPQYLVYFLYKKYNDKEFLRQFNENIRKIVSKKYGYLRDDRYYKDLNYLETYANRGNYGEEPYSEIEQLLTEYRASIRGIIDVTVYDYIKGEKKISYSYLLKVANIVLKIGKELATKRTKNNLLNPQYNSYEEQPQKITKSTKAIDQLRDLKKSVIEIPEPTRHSILSDVEGYAGDLDELNTPDEYDEYEESHRFTK